MKEELNFRAKEKSFSIVVDLLSKHHYPADSNKIDALQEIAIKQVMNEDCPVYERDVTIEEIKKTFKAYKDLLELRYLEDQ